MCRDHHGYAEFPGCAQQQIQYDFAGDGIQISRRLIRQQQTRIVHQGARNGNSLLLPAGELMRQPVSILFHFEPSQALEGGLTRVPFLRQAEVAAPRSRPQSVYEAAEKIEKRIRPSRAAGE